MAAQLPPPTRPRPHRLMVNLDTETRDAVRSMAFMAQMSQSEVAADALQALVPIMEPYLKALGQLKAAPQQALADIAAHAGLVADEADATIKRLRASFPSPPSSNTGG